MLITTLLNTILHPQATDNITVEINLKNNYLKSGDWIDIVPAVQVSGASFWDIFITLELFEHNKAYPEPLEQLLTVRYLPFLQLGSKTTQT